jgi:tripartite-type tricarboxylate transporter receptor subunit TctC
LTRFAIAAALLVSAAVAQMPTAAAQQDYPNRPIRLIIPMAAGGATDILIRTLEPKMTEMLGQQIVVDKFTRVIKAAGIKPEG